MINLFNKSNKRRLQMVEFCINHHNRIPFKELVKLLGCSDQSVKNDIKFMNDNYDYLDIHQEAKDIVCEFDLGSGLKDIYSDFLKDSVNYNLMEYIFFNEGRSVAEVAHDTYSSLSSTYHALDDINNLLARYDFCVSKENLSIEDDEKQLRTFFYHYFMDILYGYICF